MNLRNILWACAFFMVALAWMFGLPVDLTGDSGLYAAISRQMVESGDWLTLRINGEPYDQKPHLFFWLAGLGIELFGNTIVAYKLFLFLAGVSGIYFTYRLGRLLFSEVAGRLAALFTGTSQLFFLYFFDIHTDTVLQSTVILALWQIAAYLEFKKSINFFMSFIAIGLAMLTKGPVGAVLPFFFVLFTLLLKKEYRQFFHPKWLAGIAIVLFVISPALVHLWRSFGIEGLRFYFIDNNIGRVTGELTGTSTDPFFYLYNLLWAFLPWTVPVMAGLVQEVRTWWTRRDFNNYAASLLGGILVVLTVYSIARGKAPNYLMMLLPPMAVVAAGRVPQLLDCSSGIKKFLLTAHIFFLGLIFLLLFVLELITIDNHWGLVIFIILIMLAALILFLRAETNVLRQILFISVVLVATFNIFLNTTVLPALFEYQGARQALDVFKKHRSEKGVLKKLHLEEYELFFFADVPVEYFSTWEDFYAFLQTDEPWVYTNETGLRVINELKIRPDSVFSIHYRGMNELNFQFLNPATRRKSLKTNYLIKVKQNIGDK